MVTHQFIIWVLAVIAIPVGFITLAIIVRAIDDHLHEQK